MSLLQNFLILFLAITLATASNSISVTDFYVFLKRYKDIGRLAVWSNSARLLGECGELYSHHHHLHVYGLTLECAGFGGHKMYESLSEDQMDGRYNCLS